MNGGKTVFNLLGIEGGPCEVAGLGLLPINTVLTDEKRVTEASGRDLASNALFQGLLLLAVAAVACALSYG